MELKWKRVNIGTKPSAWGLYLNDILIGLIKPIKIDKYFYFDWNILDNTNAEFKFVPKHMECFFGLRWARKTMLEEVKHQLDIANIKYNINTLV